MKYTRFAVIAIAAFVVAVVPVAVFAQDAAREQLIRDHCKEMNELIDQLQRRDLVSRTNLGKEYETITRQFDAFNTRVRNNKFSAQTLEQLTGQFKDASAQFREAYVKYDDSLNELKKIDCQTDPADFDIQLTETRLLRDLTAGAVSRALALAHQYHDEVGQLRSQLVQPEVEGAAQ